MKITATLQIVKNNPVWSGRYKCPVDKDNRWNYIKKGEVTACFGAAKSFFDKSFKPIRAKVDWDKLEISANIKE